MPSITILKTAVILALILSNSLCANNYIIDSQASSVNFETTHLRHLTVKGVFSSIRGSLIWSPDNLETSQITGDILVNSLNTNNKRRDKHLNSRDFLDSNTYPTIHFISTSITPSGNQYSVEGNLTLHGVTKPLTLMISVNNTNPNKLHVQSTLTLNRHDYGISSHKTMIKPHIQSTLSIIAIGNPN